MAYQSLDFDVWADINGTIVEVVQFACDYGLNEVPKCTAVLPVGYTALPAHTASTAHAATAGIQLQVPLAVYVRIRKYSTDAANVYSSFANDSTFVIFCGWVSGIGYRRTYSGYAMTIEGTHWLSALSFSSTLSSTSHPNNPTDFIFNSRIALNAAGGTLSHWVARTAAQDVLTSTNITTDLWADALYPWFKELACEDRINVEKFGGAGGGNDGSDNEAAAALALINSGGSPPTLPFDDHGVDGDHAAAAIADDIAVSTLTPATAGNTLHGMAHTTFWDKIVGELSPKYFFKLVPRPEDALIVPFIPGLRDEYKPIAGDAASIIARDQSHQDMQARLPRAIRAYGLFAGHGSRAGGNLIPDDAVNDSTIGGMYVGRDDGIVIMKRAPKYLSDYVIPSVYSADAVGINSQRGNAFNHPNVGTPSAAQTPATSKEDAKTLLDELAHALYVNELLKQRFGDIVGPVRFDICPGSTISFQGTEGSPVPTAGELRYGSVLNVSYFFDSQAQKCHTAFRIGHVRTAAEHASDNYTVTAHPLYTTTWTGDVLAAAGGSCPSTSGSCS